jgi:transposase
MKAPHRNSNHQLRATRSLPPHQTAYRWFTRFRDDGTWERLNHHLVALDRGRVGCEASPTAAVIDTQSVKSTEAGGTRGCDAAKKIKGRKRHALVDTDGRGLELQVKLPHQVGFQVLPRRWVIERFFAWINQNRRLAKDFKGTIASAKAFLRAACVMLLTRRLARSA